MRFVIPRNKIGNYSLTQVYKRMLVIVKERADQAQVTRMVFSHSLNCMCM